MDTEQTFEIALGHHRAGRHARAETLYREILAGQPDHADALHLLGVVTHQSGGGEAVGLIERAIALKPHIVYYDSLGGVLKEQGRLDEAAACFERGLEMGPGYPEMRCNYASVLLTRGEFAQGFAEYEWRGKTRDAAPPRTGLIRPRWNGSPLAGRTLLLHAEQGFGDTLMFVRYATMILRREPEARLIIECQESLKGLLARSFPGCRVIAAGEASPPFDEHCPLPSLPLLLETTPATVPDRVPYLKASAEKSRWWRQRLRESTGGIRVGLAWAGSPRHPEDRARSLALAAFAPLARAYRATFYSLQVGPAASQAQNPPPGLRLIDPGRELHDFDDTAALVANLHLVVSVDTAVAHLAGALGRPVWTPLRFAADWRWLTGREDSPWYPTMRLFRQKTPDGWPEVIGRMAGELEKL